MATRTDGSLPKALNILAEALLLLAVAGAFQPAHAEREPAAQAEESLGQPFDGEAQDGHDSADGVDTEERLAMAPRGGVSNLVKSAALGEGGLDADDLGDEIEGDENGDANGLLAMGEDSKTRFTNALSGTGAGRSTRPSSASPVYLGSALRAQRRYFESPAFRNAAAMDRKDAGLITRSVPVPAPRPAVLDARLSGMRAVEVPHHEEPSAPMSRVPASLQVAAALLLSVTILKIVYRWSMEQVAASQVQGGL
ncbi:MAG: hypothetical protein HY078_10745 [Elusimicrobia bacterium]|nr:hypothetical protein [Elusimicrobiota bacterium]